jgi:long-chain acyl-CoA synthetase
MNSDAIGIFVENRAQLVKVLSAPHLPPTLRFIVLMEGKLDRTHDKLRLLSYEDILADGEVYLKLHPDTLPERIKNITPNKLATLVYTSGTTGVPKGAMLLHSNLYEVCKAISEAGPFSDDDLMLSFLPLSHVLERISGHFFPVYRGIIVAYAESMDTVSQNMIEVKPTIMIGVPRFFEKAYQRIQLEIRGLPKAQQYLIRWALSLGKRAFKYHRTYKNSIIDHIYDTELRVADRLVFSKIRRRFGGRLKCMIAGAAPLSEEVQTFFQIIGLPIIEGYGLTETAAPAFCNVPETNRFGTVGRPFPNVQVKIAEDGEIMLKGPTVFAGYYKNEQATKEAFRDGWFLTGDIGELDADGFLKIKDRKKDIIITAGGKHIAPQYIENLFKGDPLISHVLAYGDRRKFISALVTLNEEHTIAFAKANNIEYKDYAELCRNRVIAERVSKTVDDKNSLLATFERIKKFTILPEDFSLENNELTPTLKVKRKIIIERYKPILDSFYSAEDLEIEDINERKIVSK